MNPLFSLVDVPETTATTLAAASSTSEDNIDALTSPITQARTSEFFQRKTGVEAGKDRRVLAVLRCSYGTVVFDLQYCTSTGSMYYSTVYSMFGAVPNRVFRFDFLASV